MSFLFFSRRAVVLIAALALSGCAGGNLGALGDILGGVAGVPGSAGQQGQIVAEIQGLDSRQQVIQVRTQDGRTGSLRYDQNTVVVYQQRQYQVANLERGDIVAIQVQQDARGNAYASRIDVQQSVQERTGQTSGGSAQLQELTGRVGQIDYQRGWFELQTQYGGTVTVTLPYNPSSATETRFNRLRSGDSVRIEGAAIGNGRVELRRFL